MLQGQVHLHQSNKNKMENKKTEEKKEACVNAKDLRISKKHSAAICDFIRGKNIEKAISMLEEVVRIKRAVPMKGEIPHRKGKGMMSGRYPVNAAKEFIRALKQLRANAIVNSLEVERGVIFCKANGAQRPHKRFGTTRAKRTHLTLKLVQSKKSGEKK